MPPRQTKKNSFINTRYTTRCTSGHISDWNSKCLNYQNNLRVPSLFAPGFSGHSRSPVQIQLPIAGNTCANNPNLRQYVHAGGSPEANRCFASEGSTRRVRQSTNFLVWNLAYISLITYRFFFRREAWLLVRITRQTYFV